MNKIILIGFMGVGKTTIGSELAKNCPMLLLILMKRLWK